MVQFTRAELSDAITSLINDIRVCKKVYIVNGSRASEQEVDIKTKRLKMLQDLLSDNNAQDVFEVKLCI